MNQVDIGPSLFWAFGAEIQYAAHWRCTSRSAAVGIRPEGANNLDGTESSSVNCLPPPRAALSATITPATTMMTTTRNYDFLNRMTNVSSAPSGSATRLRHSYIP